MRRAAALWTEWLGPRGSRPPPLDRFLSTRARGDGEVAAALFAACARAVTALAQRTAPRAVPREPAALLDALRAVPLDAALAARAPEAWLGDDDLAVRCVARGVPPGFAELLRHREARWGRERMDAWLRMQGTRPPLWLRPVDDRVATDLRAEGFAVTARGAALRVEGTRPIEASAVVHAGRAEVQDLGSQLAGARVDAHPGMLVWDVCCGAGGKTLQLGAMLGGRGAVHASDVDPKKLEVARRRAKRAGLQNARFHPWDGADPPAFGPEARRGFHRVLVDAPCSATGTWRRNPDARLRPPAGGPERWAVTQRALLATAAPLVRPGGRLVYVTCSALVEEDEAVADAFEAPGFRRVSTELLGAPDEDADTLFAAVWERA